MKKFTRILFYSLIMSLLSMGSQHVNASSGRFYAPEHTTVRSRVQPTPSKMVVRMYQAAQAVEIVLDTESNDANARVVITNIIGKQIKSDKIELQSGENVFRIDVSDLVQGTYIVQVVGHNFTSQAHKFVKANP